MEPNRGSAFLALAAAGLLVINLAVLFGGNGTPEAVEESPSPADGTESTDGTDGSDGDDGSGGTDTTTPTEDPGASPGPDDPDATSAPDGDGTGGSDRPAVALTAPAGGTYRYESSGSWSISGAGADTTVELPASASAQVAVLKGGGWTARLTAGSRYLDTFTFDFTGRDGFDWTTWTAARPLVGGASTTVFSCDSDDDWYRAGDVGRVVTHVCERRGGGTLTSRVEHVSAEDVTLGDGEVVDADHLVHTATLDGSGVNGEVRLDLWLDPATGLRVREERLVTTTTAVGGGEQTYREEVAFTLVAREPT